RRWPRCRARGALRRARAPSSRARPAEARADGVHRFATRAIGQAHDERFLLGLGVRAEPAGENGEERREALARDDVASGHHREALAPRRVESPRLLRPREAEDEPAALGEVPLRGAGVVADVAAELEARVRLL